MGTLNIDRPESLTTQQKLDIREMQIEMMNITIEQERVVKIFDELKKKQEEIRSRMESYSAKLGTEEQLSVWHLDDKLEWAERS